MNDAETPATRLVGQLEDDTTTILAAILRRAVEIAVNVHDETGKRALAVGAVRPGAEIVQDVFLVCPVSVWDQLEHKAAIVFTTTGRRAVEVAGLVHQQTAPWIHAIAAGISLAKGMQHFLRIGIRVDRQAKPDRNYHGDDRQCSEQ